MIVYQIKNKINGKSYIGLTSSSLKERFSNHTNRCCKTTISKVIQEYGKENFEIIPIDIALNKKEGLLKERFWIFHLNTIIPNGYNSNPIMKKYGKNSHRVHQIECLENKKKYWGTTEAAKDLLLDPSSITKVLKGKLRATKGFTFKYCEEFRNSLKKPIFKTKKTSKYYGVSYDQKRKKWIATIHPNRKSIYIGAFEKEEDAAIAYNEKAPEFFKDKYRKINIVNT